MFSTSMASQPVKRVPTQCMVSVTGLCPFSMGPPAALGVGNPRTDRHLMSIQSGGSVLVREREDGQGFSNPAAESTDWPAGEST